MPVFVDMQEVKSLKSTIAKMETASRQRDAVLADRTALADQLQVIAHNCNCNAT